MKKIFTIGLSLLSLILFSCKSNKVEDYNYENDNYENDNYGAETVIEHPEITDDFIGDFGIIELDDMMFLEKSKGTVKPKEMKSIYLVPRTNSVEFHFRDNINYVCFILNKAERDKIFEACETFLKQYEERTVPHHKVNSKTAYVNSKCSVWFGLLTPTTGCEENDYYVNCEFINKQPYLLLHFLPSRCKDVKDTFTPKISLYMSPSQIREFMALLNQDVLNEKVKGLKEKAYTYE